MDNALAKHEASALASVAQNEGLAITQEQALHLCETERELLRETRRVFRGDPAEWFDDVEADGWLGERWEADYE